VAASPSARSLAACIVIYVSIFWIFWFYYIIVGAG
jgi:hypothetical protein